MTSAQNLPNSQTYPSTGSLSQRLSSNRRGDNRISTISDQVASTTNSMSYLTADSFTMAPKSTGSVLKRELAIGIDLFIALVVCLWLVLIEIGILPQVKKGFSCNDPTISFKFEGDTVTTAAVITSGFIPVVVIWIVEVIFFKPNGLNVNRYKKSARETAYWFKKYAIGMAANLVVLDTLKVVVGSHRPHFLDTCRPDAAINCTAGAYITDYMCTNIRDSSYFVRDSAKSFPSGHSAMSFFEAIWVIWYFQRRFPKLNSQLLLPFLQCLCLLWACFCSASRISDHRHHVIDVVTGSILGIIFAALTCYFICKNFYKRSKQCEPVHENGNVGRHTSVRRLLSDVSCKDEMTMNQVAIS